MVYKDLSKIRGGGGHYIAFSQADVLQDLAIIVALMRLLSTSICCGFLNHICILPSHLWLPLLFDCSYDFSSAIASASLSLACKFGVFSTMLHHMPIPARRILLSLPRELYKITRFVQSFNEDIAHSCWLF